MVLYDEIVNVYESDDAIYLAQYNQPVKGGEPKEVWSNKYTDLAEAAFDYYNIIRGSVPARDEWEDDETSRTKGNRRLVWIANSYSFRDSRDECGEMGQAFFNALLAL